MRAMILYVRLGFLLAILSIVQSLRPGAPATTTLTRRSSTTRLFNKTPLVANGKRIEFEPGSSLFAVSMWHVQRLHIAGSLTSLQLARHAQSWG